MKVILTDDVYKHGVAGEEVNVADGFARNYLIPQGMAVQVSPGALKRLEKLRAEAAKRRQMRDDELKALAEQIQSLTVAFPVKASETGKLYGSVTTAQVAEALEEQLNRPIDRRRIGDRPLRELGEHTLAVRLSSALQPTVTVLIHREDEAPETALGVVPESEMEYEEEDDMADDMGDDDMAEDMGEEAMPEESGSGDEAPVMEAEDAASEDESTETGD